MRSIQLAFLHVTVSSLFLPFLALCHSSLFLLSVLQISTLLQHHTSKLSRYFWLYHIQSEKQNGCRRVIFVHLELLLPQYSALTPDPKLRTIQNTCTNTTITAFAPLTFWGTVALYVQPAIRFTYCLRLIRDSNGLWTNRPRRMPRRLKQS